MRDRIVLTLLLFCASGGLPAAAETTTAAPCAVWCQNDVYAEITSADLRMFGEQHPNTLVITAKGDRNIYVPNPNLYGSGRSVARFAPRDPSDPDGTDFVIVSITNEYGTLMPVPGDPHAEWMYADERDPNAARIAGESESAPPHIDPSWNFRDALRGADALVQPALPYIVFAVVIAGVFWLLVLAAAAIDKDVRHRSRLRAASEEQVSRLAATAAHSEDFLTAAQREFEATVDALNRNVREIFK